MVNTIMQVPKKKERERKWNIKHALYVSQWKMKKCIKHGLK